MTALKGHGGDGQAGFCAHCGVLMEAGPDACLGLIPGVSHACCGHGDPTQAYVVLGGEPGEPCDDRENFCVIRGRLAAQFFETIRLARVAESNLIKGTEPLRPTDPEPTVPA